VRLSAKDRITSRYVSRIVLAFNDDIARLTSLVAGTASCAAPQGGIDRIGVRLPHRSAHRGERFSLAFSSRARSPQIVRAKFSSPAFAFATIP